MLGVECSNPSMRICGSSTSSVMFYMCDTLIYVYNLIEYILHSLNLVNLCLSFCSKIILSGKNFAWLVDFFHLPDPLSGEPKSKSAPLHLLVSTSAYAQNSTWAERVTESPRERGRVPVYSLLNLCCVLFCLQLEHLHVNARRGSIAAPPTQTTSPNVTKKRSPRSRLNTRLARKPAVAGSANVTWKIYYLGASGVAR